MSAKLPAPSAIGLTIVLVALSSYSGLAVAQSRCESRSFDPLAVHTSVNINVETTDNCDAGKCIAVTKWNCETRSFDSSECCLDLGNTCGCAPTNEVQRTYCQQPPEGTKERCDGFDNDGDGFVDEDCAGGCCAFDTITCLGKCSRVPTTGEEPVRKGCLPFEGAAESVCNGVSNEVCGDGVDNDCNGVIDDACYRAECASAAESVARGVGVTSGNSPVTCEQCPARPVDLGTGGMTSEPAIDLELDDPILPLRVTRRWSSETLRRSWDLTSSGLTAAKFPLGRGWSFTFSESLEILGPQPFQFTSEGTPVDHGEASVLWITPEGAQVLFENPVAGVFERPQGRQERLTWENIDDRYKLEKSDGSIAYFPENLGRGNRIPLQTLLLGTLKLTAEYFDSSGVCLSDSEPGPPGAVCRVDTTNGRVLTFNYESGSFARLLSISGRDRSQVIVKYGYGTTECGSTCTSNQHHLCCTKNANDELMYKFDYVDDQLVPDIKYLSRVQIGGVTRESHVWTSGRVTETETETERLAISYDPATTWPITSATVNVMNASRSYTVQFSGGRATEVSEGGCSSCTSAARGWLARSGTTVSEGLQWTRARGSPSSRFSVVYERDSSGRPIRISYNDDDLDADTAPADGTRSESTYWNETGLASSTSELSVLSGQMRTRSFGRGTANPLITTMSSTGWSIADAAAHLASAANGWGSTAQTRATAQNYSFSIGGGLTSFETIGPSGEKTVQEFWDPASTGPEAGRLKYLLKYITSSTSPLKTAFGENASTCGFSSGYDVFGNPWTIRDANGVVHCNEYDTSGRLVRTRLSTEVNWTEYRYRVDGFLYLIVHPWGETQRFIRVLEGDAGTIPEPDEFSLGQVRFMERWASNPEDSSGYHKLIERTEYEIYPATSSARNLVKVARSLSRPAPESLPCTTNAQCSSDGTTNCVSRVCVAKSCSTDLDCSGSGSFLCRANQCMELNEIAMFDYDNERRLRTKFIYISSANTATPQAVSTARYDSAGRLAEAGDQALTYDIEYTYDAMGRLDVVRRRKDGVYAKVQEFEHDRHGNLVMSIQYSIDGNGNSTEAQRTTYVYDDFGQLVRVESPDSGRRVYTYDASGRLTSTLKENGGTSLLTSYTYDLLGRVKTVSPQNMYPITYTYDQGTWTTFTDCRTSSAALLPTRNGLGRLTSVSYGTYGGSTRNSLSYGYDSHGNRIIEVEGRWTMPACARVARRVYSTVVPERLVEETYASGRRVTYGYHSDEQRYPDNIYVQLDVANSPANFSPVVTNATWGPGGRLRRALFGNGLLGEFDYAYDGSPRKTRVLRREDGKVYLNREVTEWNVEGAPTVLKNRNSIHWERFDYDNVFDRLTDARVTNATNTTTTNAGHAYSSSAWSYASSGLGDRLSGDGHSYTYPVGSSRLTSVAPAISWGLYKDNYLYNAQGAVTSRVTQSDCPGCPVIASVTATYDTLERMTSWGGTTFHYDPLNRRTRKESAVNSLPTDFFHGDGGELRSEIGCASTSSCAWPRPLQDHIYLGGSPVGLVSGTLPEIGHISAETVSFVHTGLLSEPLRATNSSREIVWKADHSAWGGIGPTDFEIDEATDPLDARCYTSSGDVGSTSLPGARSLQAKFELFKTEGGFDRVDISPSGSSVAVWRKSGNLLDDGKGCCSDAAECSLTCLNGSSCVRTSAPTACFPGPFWTAEISTGVSTPVDGLSLSFSPDSCSSLNSTCAGSNSCGSCQCSGATCTTNCVGCACGSNVRHRGVLARQVKANYSTNLKIRLRLPGQYEDTETGLFYNWNRYYDPTLGRYLQSEPVLLLPNVVKAAAFAGSSPSAYGYAWNDPVSMIDPTGLSPQERAKILEAFGNHVDISTATGKRAAGWPWLSNFGGLAPGGMRGCVGQAEGFRDRLSDLGADS